MPYIDQKSRERLMNAAPQTSGELNFLITKLCHGYLKTNGMNYQRYNDIIGALEGAKLEIYRRHISKYEDEKLILNGDINEINE